MIDTAASRNGRANSRNGRGGNSPGCLLRAVLWSERSRQTAAIRNRQRRIRQLRRPTDQLVRVRGPFEEGEVRLGVQLGVGHSDSYAPRSKGRRVPGSTLDPGRCEVANGHVQPLAEAKRRRVGCNTWSGDGSHTIHQH